VFGKLCKPDRPLLAGDRVEIYRPLMVDPRVARRELAAAGKSMGKGAGRILPRTIEASDFEAAVHDLASRSSRTGGRCAPRGLPRTRRSTGC
jgi:hypothetical protein